MTNAGVSKKSRTKPKKAGTKRVVSQAPEKSRRASVKPKTPTPKKSRAPAPRTAPLRKATKNPVAREKLAVVKAVEDPDASVDWSSVKSRYVCGYLPPNAPDGLLPRWESLAEIASALGLVLRSIERHCSPEGWVDARLTFQADLARRLKDQTTRLLSVRQAKSREVLHAGAQFLAQKVIDKARTDQLPMSDLVRGLAGLQTAARVTTEMADPDAVKGILLPTGGGGWALFRHGLDPAEDADVFDVLPEEEEPRV